MAGRARRWALRGLLAGAALLVLGVGFAFWLARSDWGREQVRSRLEAGLGDALNGTVRVGSVEGNLLNEITLTDVVVDDVEGEPVLQVERMVLDASIRALIGRRIELSNVELIRPTLYLTQADDGSWNVSRLVAADTLVIPVGRDSVALGFGSWVRVHAAVIDDGRVVVRQPWPLPPGPLADSGQVRLDSIGGQEVVVRDVRAIDARLTDLVLADPEQEISGDLASLSAAAHLLEGPPLEVHALEGTFAMEANEGRTHLAATSMDLRFDGARVHGHGELSLGDAVTAGPAELHFEALDTRMARRFVPDLDVPLGVAEGRVTLDAAVDERGGPLQAVVTFRRSADSASSRLHADGRLALGTDAAVRDMRLRLDPLNLSWMEEINADWADAGSLVGAIHVDGPLRGVLAIDANVTHHRVGRGGRDGVDGRGGRDGTDRVGDSRLLAAGGVQAFEGIAFRDLVVRMEPLQVGAVEVFAGALPVGGTLAGRVTLNGDAAGALAADLDVAHEDTTGLTRLVGDVRSAGSSTGRTLRADLSAPVLSLATVGRFAPAAGLHGTAAAELEAEGPLDRLAVDLTLEPSRGGTLALTGTLDAAEPGRRYDLDARLVGTDAAALSSRAPETALWGTASMRGSGFDPRTMDAVVQVAAVDSALRPARPAPDSAGGVISAGARVAPQGAFVRVDARLARGVATVTDAEVRLASATLTAEGALGLVSGTDGELRYTLEVDSLSDFAAWMPPDTTTTGVAARPAVQARRASVALPTDSLLADSLLADSLPAVDTLPALPRDSLSGSVRLAGNAAGNPQALSLRAEGELAHIVALGHLVTRGQVMVDARDLAFTGDDPDPVAGAATDAAADADAAARAADTADGARTEPAWLRGLGLRVEADLDTVQLAGFGFESLNAQVEHAGGYQVGEGTVRVAAVQDTSRDYRLHARYDLALARRTLELDSMSLRFDTVRWASRGPGRVSWGEGIEVDGLELVGEAGRIRVDGRVPAGEADDAVAPATAAPDALVIQVERLPVGHLADLVQDTLDVRGLLTMHAQVEGTRAAPRVEATMALDSGAVGQVHLPGIEATLDWAEGSLAVDGVLTATNPEPGGAPVTLADVTGTLALALPWDSLAGPRTLDGTLRVDSLPLASVPTLSPAVTDLRGVVRGQVAVGGTLDAPDLDGTLAIAGGGVDLSPPGVRLSDVTGELRMEGSTLFVDSLTAVSGGGPLFATGSIELEGDDGPVADLTLRARRALIADFDQAEGVRADADLRVVGPMTALAVTGTVRIREGILYAQLDQSPALDLEGAKVDQALAASEAIESVVPPSNPLSGLRADVTVRVDRNTWIRALDGTAEIYTPEDGAPLSIRYDAGRDLPALDGVVHADRGEWAFAGRRFELTTGTATFLRASELDPLLQLTAVHEVAQPGRDPLEILITVGGRLKAPVVTLSSNAQPPLPQSDLLSYLVFGTSSGSLMQRGGSGLAGSGASQIGALAAQQLSSVVVGTLFEEALADIEARSGRYGLDVLRITAAELPEELAFDTYFQNVLRGTQIEAGKYVTPRLFVAARGRTTTEALPGLRSEYRTQSGFRWTAAWEPRYLPLLPAFGSGGTAEQTRALSTFLFWKWRF